MYHPATYFGTTTAAAHGLYDGSIRSVYICFHGLVTSLLTRQGKAPGSELDGMSLPGVDFMLQEVRSLHFLNTQCKTVTELQQHLPQLSWIQTTAVLFSDLIHRR